MATSAGPKPVAKDAILLHYDTGDIANSYRGKPTTNVFTHYGTSGFGAAANNNVGFQVQGTGTFVRLGWGQTFGGYTIKPEDVVYRYDLGVNGCHYHGSTATISAGQYAIMSVDYYLSPDVIVENSQLLVFENYGGSAVGGAANLPDTTPGKWHRMTLVSGPAGGTGTQASFLYPGACGPRMSAQGYLLMKNPQVEFSSSPAVTPFVNGTRSSTQGLLDLTGTKVVDLSNVSFDSTGNIEFDGTDDVILVTGGFSSNLNGYTVEYVARLDATNRMPIATRNNAAFYKFGDNSWYYTHSTGAAEFYYPGGSITGWGHWVITYDANNVRVYRNGIFLGAQTASGTADFSQGFRIGNWSSGAGYAWDGVIPVMKIYNRALSAAEVTSQYSNYKTRFNLP
jgi:hypothetical protein